MRDNGVVIIDYTLGNLYSLRRAFQKIGCEPIISDKKDDIMKAKKIVLPGVGAFSAGMQGLRDKGLIDSIKDFVKSGRHLLGICLGMQMLMTKSEEGGIHDGLNLIKGCVKRLESPKGKSAFKIPHYGWSSVSMPHSDNNSSKNIWQYTILDGIRNNSYFYFVHSYYVAPNDSNYTMGITQYGYNTFASVIKKDNITACQFHPEISGEVGLHIFRNFVIQRE